MPTCDVAIAGAGIVGAACAFELSRAGLRVAIVDAAAPGSGTTRLSYGSLSVQADLPAQLALTRYGLSCWDTVVDYLPVECEYRRTGTLWLASDEKHLDLLASRATSLAAQKISIEHLRNFDLASEEPGLTHDLAGGLLLPADGCLNATRTAAFLIQLALKKDAVHLRQRAVSYQNHELLLVDGTSLLAGHLVVATGQDARLLAPQLPLTFSKGHVLVVETPAICAVHALAAIAKEELADAAGEMRFELRQNAAGPNEAAEVWIGSSFQPVAEENALLPVEAKVVASLLRRAIDVVPAIGSAKPLRSWTGLRTGAADGLPFIGRLAGGDGVLAAVGHGHYGATSALATARLIADELLCQTSEIDPAPFHPDRFKETTSKHAQQS